MGDELIAKTIAAHGGHELWQRAEAIGLRLSSGGLAFTTKLQGSAVRGVQAQISTDVQRVLFTPYPARGQRGVLEPDGSVRIETETGDLVAERRDARAHFGRVRQRLWWDHLDILYFATYAIWTYVATPFVFAREDFVVRELEPWDEGGERWRRLAVRFPEHIHTHSRDQVFYVDDAGLIRRHDYSAEPIGSWARAAHYCLDHHEMDGLVVPTRRRVYPRGRDNRSRRWPLLVWIAVGDVSLTHSGRRSAGSGAAGDFRGPDVTRARPPAPS
jgi:hypothetical protein